MALFWVFFFKEAFLSREIDSYHMWQIREKLVCISHWPCSWSCRPCPCRRKWTSPLYPSRSPPLTQSLFLYIYISIYLFICLSKFLSSFLIDDLFVIQSVFLYIYIFIYISIYLQFIKEVTIKTYVLYKNIYLSI